MKVGISGAHNTGKSTIARHLIKQFGLQDETDFVRRYYTSRYGVPQENLESQYLVINTWSGAVFNKEFFVIDRTPIDHLTYADALGYGTLELTSHALVALSYLDAIILTTIVTWVDQPEKKRGYDKSIQRLYQESLNRFADHYLNIKVWPQEGFIGVTFDLKPWTHGNNLVKIFLLPPVDIEILKNMSTTIMRRLLNGDK